MKRTWIVIFIIVLLSVAGLGWFFAGGPDAAYETAQVTRGDIRAFCTATGTVNPLTTVLVGTQVSGRIKALYADFNSPVTEGQLIAEIDPATFIAQLEQARANLLSARANLEQAKAKLRDAQRTLKRSRNLFKNKVIGRSELDAAETACAVAESSVGVARAQVVQAKASFDYAETNVRYTKIYSPVDGVVISREVDVGQTVAATFQTPTLFTIARDLKKMQINANVDEADIGKIAVGQVAEFIVDAYPETVFEGTVKQVRNAPKTVQNVVTYDVVIAVDNSHLKLKPGMTANVTIIVDTRRDVLRVPNAALRFWPDGVPRKESGAGPSVWILKSNEPHRVDIDTGIDDFSVTEVRGNDLTQGQHVITGYGKKKS